MPTVRIALYKGPSAKWYRRLMHRLVRAATGGGPYSHCELIDAEGWGWSSSMWDGGVRRKQLDFSNGHWDVISVEGSLETAVAWFESHKGEPYDWWGLLTSRWPTVMRSNDDKTSFCSKAIAQALGRPDPGHVSPNDMAGWEAHG